jgi:hypothetical protein
MSAPIRRKGINPYVLVSQARARRLQPGWKRAMPVRVIIDRAPAVVWRVNLMPVGNGSFLLYLDAKLRNAAAAQVGDRIALQLAFDDEYQGGPQHAMPDTLAAGLAANPVAAARWAGLPPSLTKEVLRYLATLKSDAARTRNVERALHVLGGGKGRFLAREWNP